MSSKKTAPYGTWESPITADMLTTKTLSIDDVLVDSVTNKVYHVEQRPDEEGRNVIVDTATLKDVFGQGYNARTAVHEYGGSCTTATNGKIVFSNYSDNRLYLLDTSDSSATPTKVVPDKDVWRYANFSVHPSYRNLLVSVLEDHTNDTPATVINKLVTVNTDTKAVTSLVEGADFYSSPRISPDGTQLVFVRWFHPDMPWDGGETCLAPITSDGNGITVTGDVKVIAGQRNTNSSQQPEWINNDKIIVLADQTDYLIPYIYTLSTGSLNAILPNLTEDCGDPAWYFGNSSFALLTENSLLLSSIKNNIATFYLVNISGQTYQDLNTPYVEITKVRRVTEDRVVFVGLKIDESQTLVQFDISSNIYTTLKKTSDLGSTLPAGIVSQARPLKVGPDDSPVFCTFYPPQNPDYDQNTDEKPPCIVTVHGGPTSRDGTGLVWSVQYFTSRGFAWLDVNYGGSTGFGRAYRDRLINNWGLVDSDDTKLSVNEVANLALADGKRFGIRGGSAGGFTVLSSLTRPTTVDAYSVGNSFYGISDLAKLFVGTHKFESHYMERLVGGTPETDPQVFQDRSPIYHADNIIAPMLVQQGSIDNVVPPDQSRQIAQVAHAKNIPVKYNEYPWEGHGWKWADTIKDSLESEVKWYRKVYNLGTECPV